MSPHPIINQESGVSTILAWGFDGIEDNTINQALKTAHLPFVESPVALMPDAHLGYGSTVGSVIATRGAVVPAAIGVDIGCGMIAAETTLTANDLPDKLGPLHGAIREAVPAGVGQGHEHSQPLPERLSSVMPGLVTSDESLKTRCKKQFGSLGSGNHFVEICVDERNRVWVVLHAGSRGVGKEIAERHIDKAKGLMEQMFITLPDPDLAYLVQGSTAFLSYINDMRWAQDYAAANRQAMLDAVMANLSKLMGDRPFSYDEAVNCHHNYTTQEHHHGKDLWITRKGAIRARAGDLGIIPGSMATGSFIVRGLGNKASYCSASHGAGRKMSRGDARRSLTVESLEERMAGKAWNDRDANLLVDEHPDAYKSIEDVMAAQADLVEIVHTLTQVVNYKGAEEGRRGKRKR